MLGPQRCVTGRRWLHRCAGRGDIRPGRWHAHAAGIVLLALVLLSATFTNPGQARWTPNWLGTAGQVTHPPNPSYELEAFDPARVAFTPGGLQLSIRKNPATVAGKTYPYRSGAVTGYRKQAQVFGYFSARVFVPCANGKIVNWPAFWLIGNPYKWPASGEIDVFEGLNGRAWWHFHYRGATGTVASYGGRAARRYCGWHTFAVSWRRHAIKWFYDHALVAAVTKHITSSPMFPVFSYSVTNPRETMCVRYPNVCGGHTDTNAVMRVSRFIARR